jgi:hypothetical protein
MTANMTTCMFCTRLGTRPIAACRWCESKAMVCNACRGALTPSDILGEADAWRREHRCAAALLSSATEPGPGPVVVELAAQAERLRAALQRSFVLNQAWLNWIQQARKPGAVQDEKFHALAEPTLRDVIRQATAALEGR